MSWLRLPELLHKGRPEDFPVSFNRDDMKPFGRFHAEVAGVAARFAGCRRAALVCHDSHAFATGLFGLLHAGAEVVLPPNGQPDTLQSLKGAFDHLVDDRAVEGGTARDATFDSIAEKDAHIAFFTSGSTGRPKRVIRSLNMLEREVAAYERLWGPELNGVSVLATVTHQHLYGLTFKLLWSLAAGRPFEAGTHEVWETLLAVLPPKAMIVSSPAHLSRLGGLAVLPEGSRPAAIFSAGAPLPADATAASQNVFGCQPTEIFGSTETGAIATRQQIRGGEDWRLLPGHELRNHAEGHLALYSPYTKGEVETADLVERRPGGFRFLGRADRIAKIEGKRIGLAEVERALMALPWIEAAAVIVLPGPPPRLGAAVTLTSEGAERLETLGKFRFGRLLRQELATSQEPAGMPRQWRFVTALPAHPLGKHRESDVIALFSKDVGR